jgi:methionyl-tRNA formyltransferase
LNSLTIVFAGTPEFSVPALAALAHSKHRVVAVYTQPDRPAGRGQQLNQSAVKKYALSQGLAVQQPVTLRDAQAQQHLGQLNADVMVVVAYGLLLPAEVLAAPRLGCINIHASLLPRWRGAAPIQRAILAGDPHTGITMMRMNAGLDTGPILLERPVPILANDTSTTLHDRLSALGAEALLQTLEGLASAAIESRTQPETGVTYAAKIRKEEALIDWSRPAGEIDRQVRAFNPWPVAETRWQDAQLRVWEATPLPAATHAEPGTVIATTAAGIDVATGAGVLRLQRVQLAGRKATSAAEFLNAHNLASAVLGSAS